MESTRGGPGYCVPVGALGGLGVYVLGPDAPPRLKLLLRSTVLPVSTGGTGTGPGTGTGTPSRSCTTGKSYCDHRDLDARLASRTHTRDGAADNAVGLFALHHCLAAAAAGCSLSATPPCGSGGFCTAYAEHSPASCRCALWRCCFWQLWRRRVRGESRMDGV